MIVWKLVLLSASGSQQQTRGRSDRTTMKIKKNKKK